MQANYEQLLATSRRVNWQIADLVGGDKRLDFSRPFLPETYARTQELPFLTPVEALALNHIRAHGYLAMFQLVEAFILPFVVEQSKWDPGEQRFRVPALQQFASEEIKHMELFAVFRRQFVSEFGVECGFIGPAEEIGAAILEHSPLAVAILVLGIEWMSQGHYVESIRDSQALDPQFKSLLKHHYLEEVQHAKLDSLMLQAMLPQYDRNAIDHAVDEYFEMGAFIDGGLRQQTELDLASFERARGHALTIEQRDTFLTRQHQAQRWTFLGSAMRNENFLQSLDVLGGDCGHRVAGAASSFC